MQLKMWHKEGYVIDGGTSHAFVKWLSERPTADSLHSKLQRANLVPLIEGSKVVLIFGASNVSMSTR